MFLCLPNDFTSAPRIFTNFLKPVFSHLHKLKWDTWMILWSVQTLMTINNMQ